MKTCTKCHIGKPLSDFYRQATTSDGRGSWCKDCNKANVAEWVKANPDKAAEAFRRGKMRYKYGITHQEYSDMLAAQGGVCKICRRDPSTTNRRLHLDHDHDTGQVRGIVCHQCNIGIGMFQNSPERLRAAADYLT
jgi:hypothetical protein